jgi:hypothetical protein
MADETPFYQQVALETEDGDLIPGAVSGLISFAVDIRGKALAFEYEFFRNATMAAQGRALSAGVRPAGTDFPFLNARKRYDFNGDAFDRLVAENPEFVGMLVARTWTIAVATEDLGSAPVQVIKDGEPQWEDEAQTVPLMTEDTRRSFFKDVQEPAQEPATPPASR